MNYQNSVLITELNDNILSISEEKIKDSGEDYSTRLIDDHYALLAVCDGCGGLGALAYPEFSGRTGAYLASRMVIYSLLKWFKESSKINQVFYESNVKSIKEAIQTGLQILENKSETESRVKGSMVRTFPTTLAAALVEYANRRLKVQAVWAGDSRIYCLTNQGLSQLSVDDIFGEDALSNLTKDGVLTNVISSDGNYVIHSETYEITLPCIIIAATDGCFGYIHTPMDFEYMLLSCLQNAENLNDWENNMRTFLQKISGDDATMHIAPFGYKCFPELKNNFLDRTNYVNEKYIVPLDNSQDDMVQNLWDEYKKSYYCMLKEEYRRMYL